MKFSKQDLKNIIAEWYLLHYNNVGMTQTNMDLLINNIWKGLKRKRLDKFEFLKDYITDTIESEDLKDKDNEFLSNMLKTMKWIEANAFMDKNNEK